MIKLRKIFFNIIMFILVVIIITACVNTIKEKTPPPIEEEERIRISYLEIGDLELPVNGATGYTSVAMDLKMEASLDSVTIRTLEPGTPFKITEETGDWWYIENENVSGWLEHKYCLINLPDVVPSILYDLTNTYASKFVSSGKPIPGITGEVLYEGKAYNERLERKQYIVLVLYPMAKKICQAQQDAIKEGNSLKIYEAFRPYATQKAILQGVTELAERDPEVMKGINSAPWQTNWFIATGISNHQKGAAIDVSLVKIDSREEAFSGDYIYLDIKDYTEYAMPTQIHELSMASATFTAPVSTYSRTEWQSATLAGSMNDAAVKLQTYCTSAMLTPIASEWWHFNDLDAIDGASGKIGNGSFSPIKSYSVIPENNLEIK